jgi:N-acetylglucosaminyl-diphospho-decaprenol L-rhamnosyltransferase
VVSDVGLVMVTRDRRASALDALSRVDPRIPVCVVDNGSADGTAEAIRERFPKVDVVAAGRNLGAGGRTLGARRLRTPLIAFADDDSWWARDALARAEVLFARHPRLGLAAAKVLVGPQDKLDPVCELMRDSPIAPRPDLPGPPVMGFVACGAIVRRRAFLAAGGFDERYGIGGEEERLALDLAAAGWDLAYVDTLVVHHHPASAPRPGRVWRELRNDLWSTWLRRPLPSAARRTTRLLRSAPPPVALRATVEAARGLPWVLRERRVVPPTLEATLSAFDVDR